ncbi:MAG: hypothetical protein AB7U38_11040 [Hyphomicrobiales bacterium]
MDRKTTDFSDWVGRTRTARWLLTGDLVRKFAATLNLDPPADGADAPLGCLWIGGGDEVATKDLAEDGHAPKGGFLPPIALPSRMWAGGELTFLAPLKPGADIERKTTIVRVTEKEGKSGKLAFVDLRHDYRNADRDCLSEMQTLVFTEGRKKAAVAPPAAPAGPWDDEESLTPCPVLLFRYSALTFNSHRIHYDRDYARDHEGYEDMVVHGPLMATLLLRHCERRFGADPLKRFSFRGVSPAFAGRPLKVVSRGGETVELAIIGHDGRVVMKGEAKRK